MRPWWVLTGALALGGCAGLGAPNPLSPARVTIHVSSPAFASGGTIPTQFTCQGQDISPPLRWSGVPHAARQLDLVMGDRDAPGGNFIQWQLTGIPTSVRGLAAGQVPAGAKAGQNDFGKIGYGGPCPPTGRAHQYLITVTARTGAAVYGAGTLVGTYARR
jgi:Raf kinase inhibitor-like YbhB/YbcL family protein